MLLHGTFSLQGSSSSLSLPSSSSSPPQPPSRNRIRAPDHTQISLGFSSSSDRDAAAGAIGQVALQIHGKDRIPSLGRSTDCRNNACSMGGPMDEKVVKKANRAHGGMPEEQKNARWENLSLEASISRLEKKLVLSPENLVQEITCVLDKCRKDRNPSHASRLFAYMLKNGIDNHPLLGNDLVLLLSEVGHMYDAEHVFSRLAYHDVCSWNSLITGYVRNGKPQKALSIYRKMPEDEASNLSPHAYAALFKACAELKDLKEGNHIHIDATKRGLLGKDTVVGNSLVSMYAKCGLLKKAQQVFDELPVQNVVSWNALIAGYAKHGYGEEALKCLDQLQLGSITPNPVTFICIFKACTSIGAISKGREIHAEVARRGLLEKDVRIGSALLDMYVKGGFLTEAQEVFDRLPLQNIFTWNTMIAGYAEHGYGEKALLCYGRMRSKNISPDAITFSCCLKACGSIKCIDKGIEIHAEVEKNGLLKKDLVVGSGLIDMYAKCGLLSKAREVFDSLPSQDVVTWTALILGYAEHGNCEEALNCFDRMQVEGICPNAVTFLCCLRACGSTDAIRKGVQIHAMISRQEWFKRDLASGGTLVAMYAKCGLLTKACEVFEELRVRDVISWNSLMAGYAQLGESENVFLLFEKMLEEGIIPNIITYVVLLNVCNHRGLVDKGQTYFEGMSKDYGIAPSLEHYACIIDLFGRAGQLERALEMVRNMPETPDLAVWLTLLGACRKWGHVNLAKQVFEHVVQVDGRDPSAYIFMANIFADAGMKEEAKNINAIRVENARVKET